MNEIIWFIFHYIKQMADLGHNDEREAIEVVVGHVNKVIERHNTAVRRVQSGEFKIYWHDTHGYSDNQCIFSSMLDRNETYKMIDHRDWERGAALEGFAILLMSILIIGLFCYWFGTAMFSVSINFSDIIGGLF